MRLPPLTPGDLPARELPFWRLTGPGAVLVGLAIGAGEIIVWPRITAEHGATMVWAAVIGVFLQVWVNIEVGRWAVATGESAFTGFARVGLLFPPLFFILIIAQYLLPAWARSSGLALKALALGPDHPSPDWLWTAIAFAFVALVLFGPRRVYAATERTIGILVAIITLGLILIALRVGTLAHAGELVRGMLSVGRIEPGFPPRELFGALVFAGAGGASNLFYAYYLRDKRIGMGARVPLLVNPFRGRSESMGSTGFAFPDTPENRRRFRDWLRFVTLDQVLYFWGLNTLTLLLFIFAALSVLHPQGIVPQAGRILWDESVILAEHMGPAGRPLFLVIGLATLFSTQLAIVDGVARSLADILLTSLAPRTRASYPTWYARFVVGVIVSGVAVTAAMERFGVTELSFVLNAAFLGGLMMAVYTPALLWMNLRKLPPPARPGPLHVTMMIVASAVYVGFAGWSIAAELGWLG
jgi:hypothetical protein